MTQARRQELEDRIRFRRKALKEIRDAYLALVDGRAKSYTIGARNLTRLDLDDLAEEMRELEDELDELEDELAGAGRRHVAAFIPYDW